MPTPVTHSLVGITLGIFKLLPTGKGRIRAILQEIWENKWLFFLCIVLANALDIDYVFGLFYGDLNKFHQTATHSFLFVLVLSLLSWCVLRVWRKHRFFSFWFIFLLTSSHLFLDLFCEDTSFPIGLPLFAPFNNEYFHSGIVLFPSLKKKTIADIWSIHNIRAVLIEFFLIVPFLFASLLWKRCKRKQV